MTTTTMKAKDRQPALRDHHNVILKVAYNRGVFVPKTKAGFTTAQFLVKASLLEESEATPGGYELTRVGEVIAEELVHGPLDYVVE